MSALDDHRRASAPIPVTAVGDWAPRASVCFRTVPDPYFIKDGYRYRPEPEYAKDIENDGVTWQPDVYPEAARIAGVLGASCIVDVGCGSGTKLIALQPRFDVIGIDLPGANLDLCRIRYPSVEWIEHDLETHSSLPLPQNEISRSVIVCSDVIEHLRHPERLLRKLQSALEVARAVVLSTPERELTWGGDHNGPPPNPCHVREWSSEELRVLLESFGFAHQWMSLTRSNDSSNELKTILCRLFSDADSCRVAMSVD